MKYTCCRAYLVGLILIFLLGVSPLLTTSYEKAPTKQFALAQGEYWLTGWDYRRNVTITGSSGAGTEYQVIVNVTFDSDMQTNFGDIRFTDSDGNTEIDYWCQENVSSTYAVFWVEVRDNLDTAQRVYMYYGNSSVSTTSNGYATFQFFEDWEEGSVNATRWDTDSSGGSSSFSTTDANHGYVHKIEGGAANGIQHYSTVANTSSETAVLFRGYLEETAASFQRIYCGMPLKVVLYSSYGTNAISYYDDSKTQDVNPLPSTYYDAWYTFEMRRDNQYGTDFGLFFANATQIDPGDPGAMTPDTTEDNWFYLYCRDEEYDLYNDWVAGRKYVTDEPVATIHSEESQQFAWEEIDEISLWFTILVHMWGMNTALLFLGMGLVTASGVYLVLGGKKKISMDKLYYAIVLFLLGWAMVIGVIIA